MNWDTKFASIVRETEQSLARVKSQLQTPLSTRRSNGINSTSQTKSTPQYKPYTRQLPVPLSRATSADHQHPGTSFTPTSLSTNNGILKSSKTSYEPWAVTGNVRRIGLKRRSVSFDLGSPHHTESRGGSTVMSLLSARLQDQNKEIASLTNSLSNLEATIDNQSRQIKSLQSELSHLQSRAGSNHGDMSEARLQQFKREVNMELENLRSKLTGVRLRNNPTDNSVHSIAHELHASKRLLRGDIESLQENVSSLKSKFLSQESEMSSWSSNVREMERRQDKNDKALSQLQEWQRNEDHAKTRHTNSLRDCSTQLQILRKLTSDIQSRLSLLEQRSYLGRNDSTLLPHDLAPPTHARGCGLTFNPSISSSTPLSKSSSSKLSLSQQTSQPTLRNNGSVLSPPSYRRPSVPILSPSSRRRRLNSSSSRTNPLFPGTHSHSFRGQGSREELELSGGDDTLDDVSVLSLESEELGLNESLDMLSDDLSNDMLDFDLSPPSSLLSVGAL